MVGPLKCLILRIKYFLQRPLYTVNCYPTYEFKMDFHPFWQQHEASMEMLRRFDREFPVNRPHWLVRKEP
jgi:hypothetical protein